MWKTHNYFGPGDSDYTTEPLDRDDGIAREHDLSYETARTFDDVHEADALAIKKFTQDFLQTGNWHSALGAAGLSVKYAAEHVSRTILYPDLDGDSVKPEKPPTKPAPSSNIIFQNGEPTRKRLRRGKRKAPVPAPEASTQKETGRKRKKPTKETVGVWNSF